MRYITLPYIIIASVILVSILLFLLRYKITSMLMRKKIAGREIISFDKWYETFFKGSNVKKDLAEDILNTFAKQIKVSPTQILPSDSIPIESKYLPNALRKIIVEDVMARSLDIVNERYKLYGWKKTDTMACKTIGELITGINKKYTSVLGDI
ncbi:MAG: hypothetical protein A2Y12_02800 [Planctomycetes bacterium GWF2_42_9]|nr:MAG: hypothetical protein A2Y12_02800 [Planctomycetes bacterium GWF2_42_9]HAL45830.1 hypothetical protein [Phycisphaerales bacterium]